MAGSLPSRTSSSVVDRQWLSDSHAPGMPIPHWWATRICLRIVAACFLVIRLAYDDRINSPILIGLGMLFFFRCRLCALVPYLVFTFAAYFGLSSCQINFSVAHLGEEFLNP